MDKFAELSAFTKVIEAGGFAAAARETGQSRSAVNRLVIALEERLGAQLLNRTTRQVSPTSTGRALYDRARQVLDDLEEVETAVTSSRTEPMGKLRINAPLSFGDLNISQIVVAFMARYPQVDVDLTLETRMADPVAEGFDLMIRIAEPDEETTLVDHRLVAFDYLACAAPDYLARHGSPTRPRELRDHALLHLRIGAGPNVWTFSGPEGPVTVPVAPVLVANNLEPLLVAACAGRGIAIMPAFAIGSGLRAGKLARTLDGYSPPSRMLQVIYPPARHLSAKVRLFTDFVQLWCAPGGDGAAALAP